MQILVAAGGWSVGAHAHALEVVGYTNEELIASAFHSSTARREEQLELVVRRGTSLFRRSRSWRRLTGLPMIRRTEGTAQK
jgi:hypothetical protein